MTHDGKNDGKRAKKRPPHVETDQEEPEWIESVIAEAANLILSELEKKELAFSEAELLGDDTMEVDEHEVIRLEETKMGKFKKTDATTGVYTMNYKEQLLELSNTIDRPPAPSPHVPDDLNKALKFHKAHQARALSLCLFAFDSTRSLAQILDKRSSEDAMELGLDTWKALSSLVTGTHDDRSRPISTMIRQGKMLLIIVQHGSTVCIHQHPDFDRVPLLRDVSTLSSS